MPNESRAGSDRLKKILGELSKKVTKVGWFPTDIYPPDAGRNRKGGTPVAQVAFWLNGGTGNMPARPFFTEAYTLNQVAIRDLMVRLVKLCLAGGCTPDEAMRQVGLFLEGAVIRNIKSQKYEKLNEEYAKWKEKYHTSPQMLIDTNLLWSSLKSVVETAK